MPQLIISENWQGGQFTGEALLVVGGLVLAHLEEHSSGVSSNTLVSYVAIRETLTDFMRNIELLTRIQKLG